MRDTRPAYPPEYDAPVIKVLGEYTPIANKEYKCSCCGVKLEAGKKHRKIVYKDDDNKFKSDRLCFPMCDVGSE
jgi:hypothetical protein